MSVNNDPNKTALLFIRVIYDPVPEGEGAKQSHI
jgi:hypothetical protein